MVARLPDGSDRDDVPELGVDIEIFHSNVEGEVINRIYQANDQGFDAAIFNPAGFSRGYPALNAAIGQVKFPTIEVHISNPVRRGPVSDTLPVSHVGTRNWSRKLSAMVNAWIALPEPAS